MNRRIAIVTSASLLVGTLGVWWKARHNLPLLNAPTNLTSPNHMPVEAVAPSGPPAPLIDNVSYAGTYQGLSDPRWKWWNAMEERDPSFEWKMPIDFYGKVIDENRLPISGAKIRFQWTTMSIVGTSVRTYDSKANGTFSLTGERGKGLDVYVTKEGYHAGVNSFGTYEYAAFFEWNYFVPNKDKPVTFQLSRKSKPEPLIVREACNTLSYEQGKYYYDLQRGSISRELSAGAGLKVVITRSQTAQGRTFDWTWAVEGVHATVQPTTDEFPQMAPVDAYVSSWSTEQKSNATNFQRSVEIRLYVHTGGECYALVDLQLSHPNLRDIGPTLVVKSLLNPTGSRNLEH